MSTVTFPIRLSKSLSNSLTKLALDSDNDISKHDYIVKILDDYAREKDSNYANKEEK